MVGTHQLNAEADGEFAPDEDDWATWTGEPYMLGAAEVPEGRDELTWWLRYGELPADGTARVWTPDGRTLPVRTVGRLWMCEWQGLNHPVTVQVGTVVLTLRFPPRHYLTGHPNIQEIGGSGGRD